MSVAHALQSRYPQTTACGLNTISHCCWLNLKHNTLCNNCRRVIQNHVYSHDDAYEISWYYLNKETKVPNGYIKLRDTTIRLVSVGGSANIIIYGNHSNKQVCLPYINYTLAVIDAIVLWLESEYYLSVPMVTFVECMTNYETPSKIL